VFGVLRSGQEDDDPNGGFRLQKPDWMSSIVDIKRFFQQ